MAYYSSSMSSSNKTSSKWYVDANAWTTSLNYEDPDSIGCEWSATIKVTCTDETSEYSRNLTEEELTIKRNDLINDFSDMPYMDSIVDNSYFDFSQVSLIFK